MQAVSRSMETNSRSLACPGPDPWYTPRMDQWPTTVQLALRLGKILGRQAQGAPILPGHSAALPRHRLGPPSGGSVRHSGSVVRLLPGTKEGHRQDERTHRPDHDQPVPQVRALQDGGSAQGAVPAPQAGSLWKVDMSDFYMHLLIAEEHRLFFRFRFEGISYESTALPFGLAPAPRIATKFLLPAIR